MPKNIVKTLIKFLSAYKSSKYLTPLDYVNSILQDSPSRKVDGEIFLHLAKHEEFLEKIADDFIKTNNLRRINPHNVQVFLYYTIFELNEENYEDLLSMNIFYLKLLLAYVTDESNQLFLTSVACKLFENDYVLEEIMYLLLSKIKFINELLSKAQEKDANKVAKKPVTVPVEFSLKQVQAKSPPPPVNTPEEPKYIRKRSARIGYVDSTIPQILEDEREKNREKARQLLEEASNVPMRLLETRKHIHEDRVEPKVFKASKVPAKKDVEIKGNITTTLREASRIVKEQENEIKKIEEIIKGGQTTENAEQLEEEEKREKNRKAMEDIERKHLQGLLTYEEAILAKKKLLEFNKQKMLEFKEAQIDMMEKLDKWRDEEQLKIKALVEKSQKIKQDARESEKKMQEEKQNQVRLQQYETRELLRKAYEEKKKELARRIDLIQEIRTLHEIRCSMNVKEFDPTECPNFGLLCEMSIAELQERLSLTKIRMQEELEEKRNCILKKKEEQQNMVENVRNFIAQARRMSKPKPVPTCTANLEQSPDLIELRRRLQEKRNLRMNMT